MVVIFSGINESCGGFTPQEYQTRCNPSLECVNTMGQHGLMVNV